MSSIDPNADSNLVCEPHYQTLIDSGLDQVGLDPLPEIPLPVTPSKNHSVPDHYSEQKEMCLVEATAKVSHPLFVCQEQTLDMSFDPRFPENRPCILKQRISKDKDQKEQGQLALVYAIKKLKDAAIVEMALNQGEVDGLSEVEQKELQSAVLTDLKGIYIKGTATEQVVWEFVKKSDDPELKRQALAIVLNTEPPPSNPSSDKPEMTLPSGTAPSVPIDLKVGVTGVGPLPSLDLAGKTVKDEKQPLGLGLVQAQSGGASGTSDGVSSQQTTVQASAKVVEQPVEGSVLPIGVPQSGTIVFTPGDVEALRLVAAPFLPPTDLVMAASVPPTIAGVSVTPPSSSPVAKGLQTILLDLQSFPPVQAEVARAVVTLLGAIPLTSQVASVADSSPVPTQLTVVKHASLSLSFEYIPALQLSDSPGIKVVLAALPKNPKNPQGLVGARLASNSEPNRRHRHSDPTGHRQASVTERQRGPRLRKFGEGKEAREAAIFVAIPPAFLPATRMNKTGEQDRQVAQFAHEEAAGRRSVSGTSGHGDQADDRGEQGRGGNSHEQPDGQDDQGDQDYPDQEYLSEADEDETDLIDNDFATG